MKNGPAIKESQGLQLERYAWVGLAIWMAFGLLVEGLMAFRSPVYLQDPVRRELFRLAHAHGAILCIVVLISALFARMGLVTVPRVGGTALMVGSILMPLGFVLGGIWHYESDPGAGVFLAPIGGVLVIFGAISIALSPRCVD